MGRDGLAPPAIPLPGSELHTGITDFPTIGSELGLGSFDIVARSHTIERSAADNSSLPFVFGPIVTEMTKLDAATIVATSIGRA